MTQCFFFLFSRLLVNYKPNLEIKDIEQRKASQVRKHSRFFVFAHVQITCNGHVTRMIFQVHVQPNFEANFFYRIELFLCFFDNRGNNIGWDCFFTGFKTCFFFSRYNFFTFVGQNVRQFRWTFCQVHRTKCSTISSDMGQISGHIRFVVEQNLKNGRTWGFSRSSVSVPARGRT